MCGMGCAIYHLERINANTGRTKTSTLNATNVSVEEIRGHIVSFRCACSSLKHQKNVESLSSISSLSDTSPYREGVIIPQTLVPPPRHLQTNFPSQLSLHLAQRIQPRLPPEQCRRSWLARSINHFVLVGEAVETCSRALCVSSHVLEEEPVADIQ